MKIFFYIILSFQFFLGCGNQDKSEPHNENASGDAQGEIKYEVESKGIGPVETIQLGSINQALVNEGEQIFNSKCIACHTLDEKRLGPPLGNVTQKLRPEFIMNYLLNTNEMQEKDEYLKGLIKEYNIVMPDQNLQEQEARSILEYLRAAAKN